MRFGLLYEHQLPRPWTGDSEHKLFKDAMAQVELADRLGIDHIWEVEHHFLEEYAHSSAPEVFLAACAARTKNIRIGHGVVLAPPGYNHPARVAERIATLDLISDGRVDWGTGESASRVELEGFGIDPDQKKAMWAEAVEQTADMMAMSPYPGFKGRFFSMPVRNVVPKPLQKPHPPIWVACSRRETIHAAARAGIGALTFAFVDQAVFIQQGGRNKHEHICESLNLFAAKVMPILKADQAARDARKQAELAPFIAAALKRKKRAAPVALGAVPTISAYGRTIVQENQSADGPTHHIAADITVMMDDPAEKKNKAAAE